MSGLLPTSTDASSEQEGDPRMFWLDGEDTGELLSSLSSDTARAILMSLHEDPATASEVAGRVDTSLQNARHHLTNLQEAGLVRVADTRYSQKGREMNVYAPSEEPLVVFVGNEERKTSFLDSLKGLVAAVGILGMVSYVVQQLVVTDAVQSEVFPRMADGATGVTGGPLLAPPGLVFFAGGLLVLGLLLVYRRWQRVSTPTV
ncbi:ArsR/SmtB family transcription factor [Halomarina oriensis]|uniref:Helix-turn-helix domain-containing protein n=1 Tax=Halomarina oriensis TaxID=671145 RepID=A0A6B0GTM6_9EURY|nr:winged helix-turn-helix domain-containing protein [Halomarina oriensis]MWG35485.1 helix-turn-helix domain-containing protein [Halomarina oriensis]